MPERSLEERLALLEEVSHTHNYLQTDKQELDVGDSKKAKKSGSIFGDPILIID